MFQHLQHYEKFLEKMALYQLPDIDTDVSTVNLQAHIASSVSDNWKILDFNANWGQLCFLESMILGVCFILYYLKLSCTNGSLSF